MRVWWSHPCRSLAPNQDARNAPREKPMTPEEGYELDAKQRPGVIIVMGPEEAREERIPPLGYHEARELRDRPGPSTWLEYDLGFSLSLWAEVIGGAFAAHFGRDVTADEWAWLMRKTTGLSEVGAWVEAEAKNGPIFRGKEKEQ
jgi:hypothetical protein